jgi:hypothetical protein
VSTQVQGQGTLPQGTVQLPQGAQMGPYGVQMPVGGMYPPQPQQQAPAMPTGQQVVNPNAGQSYGIEGVPPAPQPQQQMQLPAGYGFPQGQYGQPQVPTQVPMLQYPQVPQQQVQAFAQPQQPQVQGQPQQSAQVGLQTRLDGPGVPAALRGRTIGDALTLYSALEADWMRRNPQTRPQQPQVQGQTPQPQPQYGQQPQQPVAQPQAQPSWTQPFEQLIEQKLQQHLGPMIQRTQQTAVTEAYGIAKQGVSDFGALEGEVMQMLSGADPETLANPATWVGAADIVRGRLVREGRYQAPQQQGAQQLQIPGQQPQGLQGSQFVTGMQHYPQGMLPAVPAQPQVPGYGFFTEAPTTPPVNPYGNGVVPGQATPQDYEAAAKFRMPIHEFLQWKHGVNGQQMAGAR